MSTFSNLKVLSLDHIESLYSDEDRAAPSVDSPAMEIETDFHQRPALMLESDVPVDEALYMMKKAHVHAKIVVDQDERFLGVITRAVLESSAVLELANKMKVERGILTVGQLMKPRSELRGLSYSQLQSSRIGNVLATLEKIGEEHIVVVDEEKNRVCGIISANDIARALHVPIDIAHRAASFAEVVSALS